MTDADEDTPEFAAKAAEFYATHGFPYGEAVNLAWLRERVAVSSRQLMRLSLIKGVPADILQNQRNIVARSEQWIVAWLKEHPNEIDKEAE